MKLGTALRRENNNADVLRLIAACAVIWGHAYYLLPGPPAIEPIGKILVFNYSGSMAVEFFFFLSGILVTNSWINNSSAIHFLLARFFRIFPALFFCALFCIFILGPALTVVPMSSYFADKSIFIEILSAPQYEYKLPGVFTNLISAHVNGSLWTLRYELAMYTVLLAAGLCGLFRHKLVATITLCSIIVGSLKFPESIQLIGLSNMNVAGEFPAFFAFGALLAIHKDSIDINSRLVLGLILLAWAFRNGPAFQYVFYSAFLITALWLTTTRPIKAIRLPGDFSFGVYIYGWPMQQAMMEVFPTFGIHGNQVVTLIAAVLLSIASWYLIEKPSIGLGRYLSRRVPLNTEVNSKLTLATQQASVSKFPHI